MDCAISLSYFDLAAKGAGLGGYWNGYFFICAQSFAPMIEAIALPEGCMPYAALCRVSRFNYQRIPPAQTSQYYISFVAAEHRPQSIRPAASQSPGGTLRADFNGRDYVRR